MNVRFGSLAVVQHHIKRTAAFGGKAVTRQADFRSPMLNVCFHLKRTFNFANSDCFERLLSANSRPSGRFVKVTLGTHFASLYCEKNKPTTPPNHEQSGNAAQRVASRYYLFSQYKYG